MTSYVQVLSSTVAKGLELMKKNEFSETMKFVDTFDISKYLRKLSFNHYK